MFVHIKHYSRTENGYPLIIEVTKIEYVETEYNREFLLNLIPKINYTTLKLAIKHILPYMRDNYKDVVQDLELPDELSGIMNDDNSNKIKDNKLDVDDNNNSSSFQITQKDTNNTSNVIGNKDAQLQNVYKVLMDIHIMEGFLICPDTGRKFFISDGIPNMVLHEDEV